jgi:hypothetical protein
MGLIAELSERPALSLIPPVISPDVAKALDGARRVPAEPNS